MEAGSASQAAHVAQGTAAPELCAPRNEPGEVRLELGLNPPKQPQTGSTAAKNPGKNTLRFGEKGQD